MKKTLLTLALSIAMSAFAWAQQLEIFANPAGAYGAIQVLTMSDNSMFVAGTTETMAGFIMNVETGDIVYDESIDAYGAEMRGVSNDGIAVGMNGNAIALDITTGEKMELETPENNNSIANAITPDGSLIVGVCYHDGYIENPAIWDQFGVLTLLPEPTPEELGFSYNGSRAVAVSEDGKTIIGYIVDDMAGHPMIFWTLQDNGEWLLDITVATTLYEPAWGDKPYFTIEPVCVSANGRYVALNLAFNDENFSTGLGVYDMESGEVSVIPSGEEFQQAAFYPSSISNESDIVGQIILGPTSRNAFFYQHDDEMVRTFGEVFPEPDFAILANSPACIPTKITPNSSKIAGWFIDPDTYSYFSFIIILSTEGIEEIIIDNNSSSDAVPVAIYNTAGMLLDRPTTGVNIIMMSDGTSKKVLVK
ncbi:MAG: hypothetical protein ACI358_08425 [Candidatus Limimorpha sp.]